MATPAISQLCAMTENLAAYHNGAGMRFGVAKTTYDSWSPDQKAEQLAKFQAALMTARIYTGYSQPDFVTLARTLTEKDELRETGLAAYEKIQRAGMDIHQELTSLPPQAQALFNSRLRHYENQPSFLASGQQDQPVSGEHPGNLSAPAPNFVLVGEPSHGSHRA